MQVAVFWSYVATCYGCCSCDSKLELFKTQTQTDVSTSGEKKSFHYTLFPFNL